MSALFWVAVAILAAVTKTELIAGLRIPVPVAPWLRTLERVRIAVLVVSCAIAGPVVAWNFYKWAMSYEWRYLLGF